MTFALYSYGGVIMNRAKKNKLLLAILAVALFIPTVIALINLNRAKVGPVDVTSIISMKMSDLEGNTTVFDKDNPDTDKMIDMFVRMNGGATQVSTLPDALSSKPFYLVEMSNGSIEYKYKYYFDITGAQTYYEDGEGKVFSLGADAAAEFLATKYAASIYTGSSVPVLSISAGVKDVRPTEAKWAIKDASGNLVDVDCSSKIIEQNAVYPVEGGMETSFSIAPDYLHVEITSDPSGESLYNNDYENNAAFRFEGAAHANVKINAKWYHDDAREYEGEMSYAFSIEVSEAANFFLGADTIECGSAVSVTGVNVKDPSAIEFSCEPDIGYKPVFYTDGDYVRAIIPFSAESVTTLNGTTFKLTFKYGAVTKAIDLKVDYRDYQKNSSPTYDVTDAVAALCTDATKQAANDALGAIFAEGSAERYFEDAFIEAVDANMTRFFGREYTINPGGAAYRQTGVEYNAADGTTVKNVAKGKVVWTGTLDITGNAVVVEHGYGLKTIYAHLSSVSVKVGDVVDQGAEIGKCGSTGFTNTSGVYVANYVGSVAISPYSMWADGCWRAFTNPNS